MLKLATLLLVAMACACHAEPSRDAAVPARPAGSPQAAQVPEAGALAMGGPESAVVAALGAPQKAWRQDDFDWRRFETETATLEAGFYRDKLGQVRLTPKAPWAPSEALAWARALAPGFDAARLDKTKPAEWVYFEQIRVDGAPFEVQLTFTVTGDRVGAIAGELHWLD
ncbi:MAG: hypothetical protein ACK46X_01710 [Candidatus Sericytochromatia bacterium]